MVRMLISAAIHLLANAIGLLVAALVLDDMEIDGAAFIIAVVIFTIVEMLVEPLLLQMAERNVQALRGGVALVATFVGLVITNLVSDGLTINGAGTWILATVIVWVAAMIAGLILPVFMVKEAAENRKS